MTTKNRTIFLSVTCLGISSLMTQLITLREFLNVFSGNELVFGLILGNWLLLTGLGSYLGRFAHRLRHPVRWLVLSQIAIALLPIVQISCLRLLKQLFVPGLMLGLNKAFIFSFLLLLPYCLISGFLLTLFSGIGGDRQDAQQIGDVYVMDLFGDIIGGLLFSFCLVYFLSPFQILTFLFFLNILAAFFVAWTMLSRWSTIPILVVLAIATIFFGAVDLEKRTGQAMFVGQTIVFQESTPYGNLVVTQSEKQYTVYENGVPVGSTGDVMAAEETVHYALAHHNNPENVLLVSGGLTGAFAEIGKYPVKRIDYVELDPAVIELTKKIALAVEDPRISLIAQDARRFLRSKLNEYDAILIDLADPSTAQLNRFYTVEFFREVRRALKREGVFGLSLSGAENYANPEIRYLTATVYRSLSTVFPNILVIPGTRQFIIASNQPLDYNIASRLTEKGIKTRYVNADYLKARLTTDRIAAVKEIISASAPLNRDFMPAGYYALLRYWLSQFNNSLLLPVIVIGGLVISIGGLIARAPRRVAPAALCATGFAGMGLEIVIILAFQVCYGYVYQHIGVIITAFLIGTALGGVWSGKQKGNHWSLMFCLDFLLGVLSFLLVPVLLYYQSTRNPLLVSTAPFLTFPALTAIIGFLVGAQFPTAARLTFNGVEKTAGTLYALDFLGSALSALIVTAFFIPLIGIIHTCYLIGTIKLLTSSALWLSRHDPVELPSIQYKSQPAQHLSLWVVFSLFAAIGITICMDESSTAIYALSFIPAYHWGLLGFLLIGLLRAMQIQILPGTVGPWISSISRTIFERTRVTVFQWVNYFGFSLVSFYPIFRCYFNIPYLFCHVCPRQCVFGFLRPYLIPAALIMNLRGHYWCFNCCPIGTFSACQARVAPKPVRLPKLLKTVPLAVLGFTFIAYFKVQFDLDYPEITDNNWYITFYNNIFAPVPVIITSAIGIIIISIWAKRFFCDFLCPVGTLSRLFLRLDVFLTKKTKLRTPKKCVKDLLGV